MRPVRLGDRGPAVEDIQRRLRTLGYDLGRAGVDGLFFGETADAVRAFQSDLRITEDGWVGDQTWAALVDATFMLGDRMLYLRVPHFHGRDVRVLQQALNILGFACGQPDGIFGAYTERAVRELQRNAALPADGIVGPETVRVIESLKHVWEGKEARAHSAATLGPARAAEVLSRLAAEVSGLDAAGDKVAGRVTNLAIATTETSRVRLAQPEHPPAEDARLIMRIGSSGTASAVLDRPVVHIAPRESLASRLLTAVTSSRSKPPEVIIELEEPQVEGERGEQSVAVALLDALCVVFD